MNSLNSNEYEKLNNLYMIFSVVFLTPDKIGYCKRLILIKCSLFKIFASLLSKRGWLKSEIDAKVAAAATLQIKGY